jgi:hypothetical protein
MIVVLTLLSIGLAGSRLPKSRAAVLERNVQFPRLMTVAVTETTLESAAKLMLVAIKIERVMIAMTIVFNWKLRLGPLMQPTIYNQTL